MKNLEWNSHIQKGTLIEQEKWFYLNAMLGSVGGVIYAVFR